MTVITVFIFSVIAVSVFPLLKKYNSPISVLAEVAVTVILILGVLPELNNIFNILEDISEKSNISSEVFETLVKSFLTLSVGGVAVNILRDNGENGVADIVEIIVRVMALVSALPIFSAVLISALTLLK